MNRILSLAAAACLLGLAQAQQTREQANPCDPGRKFKVVPDATYCDRFWECVNNQPQLYDCPNGLVFVGANRGIAEGCDYPWRGPAQHNCRGKQLANPPISTEHCDWLYGIFGHEKSCTRYWSCWNGTATEQFCIGGLLYNEDTHACDWPEMVQGCQKHPLCSEDPNQNVALGKSCERYWACQGGYPRLQRCPATLVFDKQSRRCVNPPTVDCEAPSTTPQPPQEEERPIQFRQQPLNEQPIRAQQVRRPLQPQFIEEQPQQLFNEPPPPPVGGNFRPAPIQGAIPFPQDPQQGF